jgi:hypothetical protein
MTIKNVININVTSMNDVTSLNNATSIKDVNNNF